MKKTCGQRIYGAALAAAVGIWFAATANAQRGQDAAAPPAQRAVQAATTNAVPEAGESVSNAPLDEPADAPSRGRQRHREAVVAFGSTAELKAGESAEAVVAILGSAIARGDVSDAVVAIAGDVTVSGKVHDAAVAVLGNVTIEPGATVEGDVVSVGGTVTIADGAKVEGEVVCVGGKVDIAEGATVQGGVQEVPVPGLHMLKDWVVQCVFKLRPLAPQVGWVWIVAGAFFLVYLLVAVAMPRPVESCVRELTRRPATSFLMGLLTILLVPVIMLILAATGVGVFVIPFLLAALLFGALIGKVAFLEFLGESVVRAFSTATQLKAVMALLLGSIILTVLYLVPVLGVIAFMVTGLWALGAVVMGMFGRARRELPERPASPPSPAMAAPANPAGAAGTASFALNPEESAFALGNPTAAASTTGFAPGTNAPGNPESASKSIVGASEGASSPIPLAAPASASAAAPEALISPRASFWERMGAGFLDVVLVSILGGLTGPFWFLVALAYFAGMWTWKGTTVGGIVLNLKVVRLDDQPVTITVGLVRALAAAFSVVMLFLGFLWIAWDKDKQAWHDKIAGTVVVRLPRGMPLVCL
jgi:uncharacterized RDD family membrane protein YckC